MYCINKVSKAHLWVVRRISVDIINDLKNEGTRQEMNLLLLLKKKQKKKTKETWALAALGSRNVPMLC